MRKEGLSSSLVPPRLRSFQHPLVTIAPSAFNPGRKRALITAEIEGIVGLIRIGLGEDGLNRDGSTGTNQRDSCSLLYTRCTHGVPVHTVSELVITGACFRNSGSRLQITVFGKTRSFHGFYALN